MEYAADQFAVEHGYVEELIEALKTTRRYDM
jgi:Zn-dependent protease with chaperone function